jgi:hypothetical protein
VKKENDPMAAKPTTSAPVTTPTATKLYDGSGPNEWSFTYDGPVSPSDVGSCDMCTAVSRGACPTKGHPALHCSSCQALVHGHCHNHCGISRALAEHPNHHVMGPKDAVTFGLLSKAILDTSSALTGTSVYVKAVVNETRISLDIFAR